MAKKNKYRVTETDNLLELAKKFQTSVASLLEMNGIQSLTPGQTIRVPTQKAKGQAGYYSTGEGERKTVNIGGQDVRMGPNTTITPNRPAPNVFQQFLNALTGQGLDVEQGMTAAAPGSLVGVPLQGNQQYLGNAGGPKVNPSPVQFTTPPAPFSSAGSQIRMNETYTPPFGNQQQGGYASQFYPTGQPQFSPQPTTQSQYRPAAYGGSYNPTVQPVQPAPFMTQAMITPQTQPAPFMTQSMLNPPVSTGYQDYGQRVNAGTTPTNALPKQTASPLITPSSRAAGKAQFMSGNGINAQSGYIPTRNDVWEMKVAARRRRLSKNGGDPVAQMTENTGNAVNQNVTWRA